MIKIWRGFPYEELSLILPDATTGKDTEMPVGSLWQIFLDSYILTKQQWTANLWISICKSLRRNTCIWGFQWPNSSLMLPS